MEHIYHHTSHLLKQVVDMFCDDTLFYIGLIIKLNRINLSILDICRLLNQYYITIRKFWLHWVTYNPWCKIMRDIFGWISKSIISISKVGVARSCRKTFIGFITEEINNFVVEYNFKITISDDYSIKIWYNTKKVKITKVTYKSKRKKVNR